MTYRRTTPKPSSRKRQDRHRRVINTTLQDDDDDDDDYDSVVQSDESPNASESDQPQNDDASYADSDSQTDPPLSGDRSSSASERANEPVASPEPPPANLPYVHIAAFPTFRGSADECPDKHLSRFAKVCRANNAASADAMARIFPVTLEDEASLWYDLNIEPYERQLTWAEIKSSFSHAYGSAGPAESPRSALAVLRQGGDESVRSYFLRLQWLVMRKLPGHGLSDEAVREIFVGGLRGDLRDSVAAQKPGSLSEALRWALAARGSVDAAARMVRRSVSMAAVAEMGDGGKKKGQSQCQCWKHQCWKRNGLERNSSNVTQDFKRVSLV